MKICPTCQLQYDDDVDFCPADGMKLRVRREASTDPLLGRALDGRWIIEEKLGEGGMGAVYRGHQRSVNRTVAIKTLRPQLVESDEFVNRFFREAQIAANIAHPHCVTILDYGEDDGTLYLAMEFLEGTLLTDRIEAGGLTAKEIIEIGIQTASALSAAHDQNIVHRDLKPDNIYLLEVPGGGTFVKVLDFGIAKLMDDAPGGGEALIRELGAQIGPQVQRLGTLGGSGMVEVERDGEAYERGTGDDEAYRLDAAAERRCEAHVRAVGDEERAPHASDACDVGDGFRRQRRVAQSREAAIVETQRGLIRALEDSPDAAILGTAVWGFIRYLNGTLPPAESAELEIIAAPGYEGAITTVAFVFLLARAFSSGCAALTGVEAIANGVPAFQKPKSRNAATTRSSRPGGGSISRRNSVMFEGLAAAASAAASVGR